MKGTVSRVELIAIERDEHGVEIEEYGGYVFRVRCNGHGFSEDFSDERQAHNLARDSSSFCPDCQAEVSLEAHRVPASDLTEATHFEQRALERAEESEREIERGRA